MPAKANGRRATSPRARAQHREDTHEEHERHDRRHCRLGDLADGARSCVSGERAGLRRVEAGAARHREDPGVISRYRRAALSPGGGGMPPGSPVRSEAVRHHEDHPVHRRDARAAPFHLHAGRITGTSASTGSRRRRAGPGVAQGVSRSAATSRPSTARRPLPRPCQSRVGAPVAHQRSIRPAADRSIPSNVAVANRPSSASSGQSGSDTSGVS